MTGRHAHAPGTGTARSALWLAKAAGAVVATLVVLAAIGAAFYYLFIGSNLVVAYSALSVFWVAMLVRYLVRRSGAFWPWFSVGALLSAISGLITALAHRHEWLAGHLHLASQVSDWVKWIGVAFLAMAVVLGIRSGELLWKRRRPRSAVAPTEAGADGDD